MSPESFVGVAFIVILLCTMVGLLVAAWAIHRHAKQAYETRLKNQAWRDRVDSHRSAEWLLNQRVAQMLRD